VDEQMSLIDYEIGAGLMKPGGNRASHLDRAIRRVALRLVAGLLPFRRRVLVRRTRRFLGHLRRQVLAMTGRRLVIVAGGPDRAALGCASAPPLGRRPADPTTQWVQAGRKVDFAITQTKVMIQKARGASYLPDLHMRLAELYTERARYAWLVMYERRRARGDDSRAVEAPEARLLKNLAIGVYSRLLREFPSYARADEATFLMAHEFRELGEFDNMRETYEKLIETYPKSRYRFDAYLALGDHAFDANDLTKAERYYNLILAAPRRAMCTPWPATSWAGCG
jgi:hypothetical protein